MILCFYPVFILSGIILQDSSWHVAQWDHTLLRFIPGWMLSLLILFAKVAIPSISHGVSAERFFMQQIAVGIGVMDIFFTIPSKSDLSNSSGTFYLISQIAVLF